MVREFNQRTETHIETRERQQNYSECGEYLLAHLKVQAGYSDYRFKQGSDGPDLVTGFLKRKVVLRVRPEIVNWSYAIYSADPNLDDFVSKLARDAEERYHTKISVVKT
jgi:hypothetical protein